PRKRGLYLHNLTWIVRAKDDLSGWLNVVGHLVIVENCECIAPQSLGAQANPQLDSFSSRNECEGCIRCECERSTKVKDRGFCRRICKYGYCNLPNLVIDV